MYAPESDGISAKRENFMACRETTNNSFALEWTGTGITVKYTLSSFGSPPSLDFDASSYTAFAVLENAGIVGHSEVEHQAF